MPNVNFALSSNNKDQLRELYNDLIKKLNGSKLADNLIMSQQVDYLSSALIPAEAAENNQEHLVAIRYSTRH